MFCPGEFCRALLPVHPKFPGAAPELPQLHIRSYFRQLMLYHNPALLCCLQFLWPRHVPLPVLAGSREENRISRVEETGAVGTVCPAVIPCANTRPGARLHVLVWPSRSGEEAGAGLSVPVR